MSIFDKLKGLTSQAESGIGKIKLTILLRKLGFVDGYIDVLIRECPNVKFLVDSNSSEEAIITWVGMYWSDNKKYWRRESDEIPEGVEETLQFCQHIRLGMAKGFLLLPHDSYNREKLGIVSPLEEDHIKA